MNNLFFALNSLPLQRFVNTSCSYYKISRFCFCLCKCRHKHDYITFWRPFTPQNIGKTTDTFYWFRFWCSEYIIIFICFICLALRYKPKKIKSSNESILYYTFNKPVEPRRAFIRKQSCHFSFHFICRFFFLVSLPNSRILWLYGRKWSPVFL